MILPLLQKSEDAGGVEDDLLADPGLSFDKGEAVGGAGLARRAFQPVTDVGRRADIAVEVDGDGHCRIGPRDGSRQQPIGKSGHHAAMQASARIAVSFRNKQAMPETIAIYLVKDGTVMQGEGAAVQAADKGVGRRARIGFEGHREGQLSFCDVCPYRGRIII